MQTAVSGRTRCQDIVAMQPLPPLGGSAPPASFLSLPFELRYQIYRLMLRSLPRVQPMLSSPTVPTYCLQNLDPRPFFVHPQIRHDIEAILASHTRIQIPPLLDRNGKSTLSASTQQWLQESKINFKRIRVWSGLPVPIILDMNILVDAEVAVHYKWRLKPGRRRLYTWGRWLLEPALPIILQYLAEGLRKRVGARGGKGVGIGEIDFLMGTMDRFREWFSVHRILRSDNSRLSARSYEKVLADRRYWGGENREDFRQRLEWWDDVEAEVKDLEIIQSRVLS